MVRTMPYFVQLSLVLLSFVLLSFVLLTGCSAIPEERRNQIQQQQEVQECVQSEEIFQVCFD